MHSNLAQQPAPVAAPHKQSDNVFAETVVSVRHYTETLFSFRVTRPRSFRFRSGEFVMIGLPGEARPLFRAYSVASPSWDDELEFYSIKVADGALTARLQAIRPGDTMLIRKKATGTLVNDALTPARRLTMISTGTGIAPFASLIRDPETYEKFEQVVMTQTCRGRQELAYGRAVFEDTLRDPLIGELAAERLRFYPSTTREPSERMGRITQLIESGRMFADLEIDRFDRDTDRVMICGSAAMLKDVKEQLVRYGLSEGSNSAPGDFVYERAFVD